MKHVNRTITVLVFIFLYIPMIALAVASFNEGLDIATFKGFTFRQYANLFRDETLLTLLRNSLIIAILSSLLATFFGTMAAVGIHSMKGQMRKAVMTLTNIPMTNPDIVTGVALALLFAFTGTMLKINSILGFWTLLIAHITFNIPYVIFNVGPKLRQLDPSLYNAALDLGCTPRQAFTKVIMPQLSPAILSAFLICLTYSIDDFMISYFNSGTMQTLPIAIYSMTRKKVSPEINALSAVIFCVILAIILISNAADSRAYRRNQKAIRKAMLDEGGR